MSTTFANTIDGNPLYAKRAEEDQNGLNIDQTYAKKSELPTVNDGTLTIQKNGTTVDTFTANSSSNKTVNIEVPTKTSDLTNDSGFITASDIPAQVQSDWNESDSSDPAFIKNKPSIPTKTSDLQNDSGFVTNSDIPAQVQSDWNESNSMDPAYIKNKPSIPAAQVNSDWNASSGVAEILNKPSIPSKTSDLQNDSGYITANDIPAQVQANWNETDNTDPSYIQNKPTIPAAQVNSDWNANSGVAQILNKPNLATVATSGSYNDLTDKPTIPSVPVQDVEVDGSSVVNGQGVAEIDLTPYAKSADLAAVATSGDYDDLTNKPTIPAAQVNSDWNSSSGVSQILNKPTLAAVATSGDYNDLSNKPSIPAAQVQSNWSESDPNDVSYIQNKPNLATVATSGSYNDLSDKPSIPTIPVQDVEVDGQSVLNNQGVAEIDLTPYAKSADLASVATSGSYNDLSNKPSIPAAQVNSDWNANSGVAQILNKPNLATVATSGSYNDLTDKPSIPAAQVNSDWNASSGVAQILNKPTLSAVATSGDYDDLTNKPSIPAAQVNSDWNSSSGVSEILNKPNLSTVATSGSYNDLTDKPSIPAAQVNSDWNASSGVAEILNKPTIRNVPDVGSTDDGKILTAAYSGGVGSYSWQPASGSDIIAINLSDITVSQDVIEIASDYENGKVIYIKDDIGSNYIYTVYSADSDSSSGYVFASCANIEGNDSSYVKINWLGLYVGSNNTPNIEKYEYFSPNMHFSSIGIRLFNSQVSWDKNEFVYLRRFQYIGGSLFDSGTNVYRALHDMTSPVPTPPESSTSSDWAQSSLDQYYRRTQIYNVTTQTGGVLALEYKHTSAVLACDSDIISITNADDVKSVVIQWTVSNSTTLPTMPSGYHSASANPSSLTVGKTYQLSLLNNCYSIVEFA